MGERNQYTLPVMEHFFTIQGEGYHTGEAAYFVRLAGCDVGCIWCDVKESWEISPDQFIDVKEIASYVIASSTKYCVITGGEPCMYDLTELVNRLQDAGINVGLETSGCYTLKGNVDWYCFSPKKFKKPIEEAYVQCNELKIVINHPSDFEWAEKHASHVNEQCLLYLQPEWSKQERFLPMIIEYVKKNPARKISLQTHKFMNIP